MSVALLGSLAPLIVDGENVTIKSRSIANGMTTGTIGTTAVIEVHNTTSSGLLVITGVQYTQDLWNLRQQTSETAMMYLVVV